MPRYLKLAKFIHHLFLACIEALTVSRDLASVFMGHAGWRIVFYEHPNFMSLLSKLVRSRERYNDVYEINIKLDRKKNTPAQIEPLGSEKKLCENSKI